MSDVLVKGMDMPTACRNGKCNFACSAAYQTGLICIVRKQYVVPGDVPADCPCSFVPPHGRLGDLDALIQDLKYDVELDATALDSMEIVGDERRKIQDDKDFKQNCIFWIDNAPTVIPASKEGE